MYPHTKGQNHFTNGEFQSVMLITTQTFIYFNQGPGFKRLYQIHLKSQAGPINVLLVNKDTEDSEPVVVQVPPPSQPPSSAEEGASGGALEETSQNQDPSPHSRQSEKAAAASLGTSRGKVSETLGRLLD